MAYLCHGCKKVVKQIMSEHKSNLWLCATCTAKTAKLN